MYKYLKALIFVFLFGIVAAGVYYHELISYGFSQLKGQLKIVWNARPVEEVLKDVEVADSVKYKLLLIQEIKAFAVVELGLEPNDNYSTFYKQNKDELLWALSATEPYALKYFEWNFPFMGSVTYKGFFDKERGLKEKQVLEKKGYDIDWGIVSAWSTLGFFKDPIFQSFLNKTEGRLANLIIHELTHGTIYLKNDVEFNENLASLIGDRGALKYLEYRFGKDSKEYQEYIMHREDSKRFQKYIVSGAAKLDSLYNHIANFDEKHKLQLKIDMIDAIIKGLDTIPFHQKEKYLQLSTDIRESKNAFFMDYLRYNSQEDSLVQVLDSQFKGDIKAYIQFLALQNK
ncbi:MAG: aminopeptidase [Bacteroidia bacterium]